MSCENSEIPLKFCKTQNSCKTLRSARRAKLVLSPISVQYLSIIIRKWARNINEYRGITCSSSNQQQIDSALRNKRSFRQFGVQRKTKEQDFRKRLIGRLDGFVPTPPAYYPGIPWIHTIGYIQLYFTEPFGLLNPFNLSPSIAKLSLKRLKLSFL